MLLGLVYGYLPLMVFPLYVTLERMDRTLVEASKDLGAGRWATFRQVTLPIALPGLVTGSILVFIPMMGEYVIPQILGYGRTFLMGNALVLDFLEARNWPAGSARAVGLILIMIVDDRRVSVVREPRPADPRRERPVTAPAVSAAAPVRRTSAPRQTDRWSGLVEFYFRFHTLIVYVFLYLPIVVVVLFAFNGTDRVVTKWGGFSIRWFETALADEVVRDALTNSFIVAIPNAILATVFGTMAALGLQRVGKRLRLTFDTFTYMSVIVPEIVIALSTLVLFATGFDFIESTFGVKLRFGYPTIIAAHVLFNLSLVLLLVRARLSGMDRTLTDASADLFATPWRTFRQITFPQLLPAIVAGFLLAFTFSFDDYVITTFTSGPGSSTLPLYIFGQVKRGVTPETNAVATMMLAITLILLFIGQLVLIWQSRRAGRRASMGSVIAET